MYVEHKYSREKYTADKKKQDCALYVRSNATDIHMEFLPTSYNQQSMSAGNRQDFRCLDSFQVLENIFPWFWASMVPWGNKFILKQDLDL